MTQPDQTESITDERLCWLIVREQLAKQAKKPGAFGWLTLVLGWFTFFNRGLRRTAVMEHGRGIRQERARDRMADYALAVDDAAGNLSAEERHHLRTSRELPEWFMADVERRFAAIRKTG